MQCLHMLRHHLLLVGAPWVRAYHANPRHHGTALNPDRFVPLHSLPSVVRKTAVGAPGLAEPSRPSRSSFEGVRNLVLPVVSPLRARKRPCPHTHDSPRST